MHRIDLFPPLYYHTPRTVILVRFNEEIDYAKIARAYFEYRKVYRYRMKKISDMTDEEVIWKCHCWQEENNMVDDYWNFVKSYNN